VSEGEKMIRVGDGIYQRGTSYYERPKIHGRRTWRKLDGHTLKVARESLAHRKADVVRSKVGLARDPYAPISGTVGEMLTAFSERADGPVGLQAKKERSRIKLLRPFWERIRSEKINPQVDCRRYFTHRIETTKRKTHCGRAVDLELNTLSAALTHAVNAGALAANPISNRPRFRRKVVNHCRDFAPLTGDELHKLAAELFSDWRSQPLGWQLLVGAMTGCRTSEVVRLRWDGTSRRDPGFIEGDHMWVARSKNGVNPFVQIHPALADALKAMRSWRAARKNQRSSPWLFSSSRRPGKPVEITSLTKALRAISERVVGHLVTSHGLRSFFVTVRRSQGIPDAQIAAEIGDKSGASIIVSTYGAIPPNWSGAAQIDWMPAEGKPAWTCFDLPGNVISLENAG
jgi:integrase